MARPMAPELKRTCDQRSISLLQLPFFEAPNHGQAVNKSEAADSPSQLWSRTFCQTRVYV